MSDEQERIFQEAISRIEELERDREQWLLTVSMLKARMQVLREAALELPCQHGNIWFVMIERRPEMADWFDCEGIPFELS